MLEALSRGHQAWPWGAYVDFDLWLAITLAADTGVRDIYCAL